MNTYITGTTIRKLREAKGMTQLQLAEEIGVSSKAVSKWETAKGLPDISLIEALSQALGVSVMELMSGETVINKNASSNMLLSKFYVCPVCGNVIHSTGEAVIHCHGILLSPCQPEESNEQHKIFIERVEDEYFVQIEHDMMKNHYISFIAALSSDKVQMIKLYPEGNSEARVKMTGVKKILYYCNRDGLFSVNVIKGIDDRQKSYEDVEERRALEDMAKRLFT